jgi:hypothetical protein
MAIRTHTSIAEPTAPPLSVLQSLSIDQNEPTFPLAVPRQTIRDRVRQQLVGERRVSLGIVMVLIRGRRSAPLARPRRTRDEQDNGSQENRPGSCSCRNARRSLVRSSRTLFPGTSSSLVGAASVGETVVSLAGADASSTE